MTLKILPSAGIIAAALALAALIAIFLLRTKTKKYNINFVSGAGIHIKPLRFKKGEAIKLPVPELEGLVFLGWYRERTLAERFSLREMPAQDITVYGKFQAAQREEILPPYRIYTAKRPSAPKPMPRVLKAKRLSFSQKIEAAPCGIRQRYEKLKERLIIECKLKARASMPCESFRRGKKLAAKITLNKKTLRLFLALDINGYPSYKFFQRDYGKRKAYRNTPFSVKVNSDRALARALILIGELKNLFDK